jgi:hypothetical protein
MTFRAKDPGGGPWGGERIGARLSTLGIRLASRMASRIGLALILVAALLALVACGGDDDGDGGGDSSSAELSGSLPTAEDLGLDEQGEFEWETARELLAGELVIGGTTNPGELGTTIDEAGFEGAAGINLEGQNRNVRIRVIQFDSEEGALEARDLLHAEDLKPPCPDECIVTPVEYELDDVPDSAAVHHLPTEGELPPGQSRIEAHHAEFVIGSRLYVVQVDGKPSAAFSAEFDELMNSVYETASNSG